MVLYKTLVKKVSIPPNKKTKQKQYETTGKLAVVDQGQKLVGGFSNDYNMKLECNLPVIIFGDHTCIVKYINFPFGAGADGIKVLEPSKSVLPKYLYYGTHYLTLRFPDKGYARHYQHIEKMDIPLPSLPEQQRIVTRIEELFSELDKGVETLRTIQRQLAVYRQAVLKEAFEDIKIKKNCIEKSIFEICESIVDCPHSTPKWTEHGLLCLRTTNFRRGYLDLAEHNYVSQDTYNERIKRLKPLPGDVLYSREGAILGLACIIPTGLEVCLGQRMMLLRVNEQMNNKFLMHYLNSPYLRNIISNSIGGTASPHINVGDIKSFLIPVPNIGIQHNIVGIIESRLSVCDSIERTVETALAQSDAMRQSILKQAFEGSIKK